MKVRCLNCGLVLEKCLSLDCVCPECGGISWYRFGYKEEIDKTIEELNKIIREWLEEKGYMTFRKKGIPENPYLPKDYKKRVDAFQYRKDKKEEGLAFEIFDVKDGNKIRNRKIYLNGHIEGFKGDPCIVNHIFPKIQCLKACLRQMNKDYRDLIETYMVRGLPIDNVPLHELYIKEMEGINNIKI